MSENYNFLHGDSSRTDGYNESGAGNQIVGCIMDLPPMGRPLDFWQSENAWKDKELAALNKQIIEKDEEIKYLRRLVLERINEWN